MRLSGLFSDGANRCGSAGCSRAERRAGGAECDERPGALNRQCRGLTDRSSEPVVRQGWVRANRRTGAIGGGTWHVARLAAPHEGGLEERHICKVFNVLRLFEHYQSKLADAPPRNVGRDTLSEDAS